MKKTSSEKLIGNCNSLNRLISFQSPSLLSKKMLNSKQVSFREIDFVEKLGLSRMECKNSSVAKLFLLMSPLKDKCVQENKQDCFKETKLCFPKLNRYPITLFAHFRKDPLKMCF